MAGAMRKMGLYLGLVEDDDRYGEFDDRGPTDDRYDRDGASRGPDRAGARAETAGERAATVSTLPERRGGSTALATADPSEAARITTLHPRTYNEARQLGEEFREGVPVIMNLTDMDDVDAKRLVDFAAGLVFGLHGTIERVTQKVFLLSPVNVDVTAEEKERIAEGGFFNQS